MVFSKARSLVSKKKNRFQEGGFDLDLTYITDNIIAMGFPSEGRESMYRNPLDQVQRFLDEKHGEEHVKVYNLCSERDYSTDTFKHCTRFPFDDHNPAPLETIIRCCEDMQRFLQAHAENAVAIHCKAGKGRTGLIISCFLVFNGMFSTAQEALDAFGDARTKNSKGVTIPSQIRYVGYFQEYLSKYYRPERPFRFSGTPVTITRVKIHTIPSFDVDGGCDPYFILYDTQGGVQADSRKQHRVLHYKKKDEYIDLDNLTLSCSGDTRFQFFDYDKTSKDDKMFRMHLHTSFLPPSGHLRLEKNDVDQAVKDKKSKDFESNFAVELWYRAEE